MLHRLRQRAQDEQGFTLIELLVVVLIIGILAAIAIPSFLNQRQKAQDASAKSDARTSQTAAETYFTNEQTYPTTAAQLQGIENALNNANITAVSGSASTFSVEVTSKSGTKFTISRAATGVVSRTCTPVNTGACPSSGSW
jgi:type IV pilus assembly protein PilA